MSEKLTIALFKGEIIHISSFQKAIHTELYCPFCYPPLRITYNSKGFFMAWKGKGGHNCEKGQVIYFDADWKGRKLTEIAFGKINYSTKINKFFLNLNNDYQFEIMETQKAINYFKDVEYRYYDFKQYNKNNTKQFSNINIVSKEDVIEASKVLTYNDKVDLNDEINISKLEDKTDQIEMDQDYLINKIDISILEDKIGQIEKTYGDEIISKKNKNSVDALFLFYLKIERIKNEK